jgi:predicted amidohydrolase
MTTMGGKMGATVRVGVVQMAMSESRADNLRRAGQLVSDAASQGAKLVALPELFADRYFPQRMDAARYELAEAIPGEVTTAIALMAKDSGVFLVGGVYERAGEGLLFNTALLVAPNGRSSGSTARCTSRMGPATRRSSTSPPATSASPWSPRPT